jgi:O-antigen ligase
MHTLRTRWLGAVAVLLFGYAAFGRSFAYVGISPVYIGDVILLLGVMLSFLPSFLVPSGITTAFRSRVTWFLAAFCLWGALRTLPYIGEYKLDALRDAAIWGYAGFAVLVGAYLLRNDSVDSVPQMYGRLAYWLLFWFPFGLAISIGLRGSLPEISASVPLLVLKSGDVGVHLAGIGVFLLLGLDREFSPVGLVRWRKVAIICWFVSAFVVVAVNRGGMLAILFALFLVTVLGHSMMHWRRFALYGFGVAVLILAINPEVQLGERDRYISPQQVVENFTSVFSTGGRSELQGTREWRTDWWKGIVAYTFAGQYFWTGKGYGVNLAYADGVMPSEESSVRSPHNSHLTILGRSGVPGLALWLLLQSVFAVTLWRTYRFARKAEQETAAKLCIFVLAYWLAMMVNASFDPYLEGPQGGIWYWSLMGFGIALAQHVRKETPLAQAATA